MGGFVLVLRRDGSMVCFFFFKQKTAYEMCGRDWSSDVCSSDLSACCRHNREVLIFSQHSRES